MSENISLEDRKSMLETAISASTGTSHYYKIWDFDNAPVITDGVLGVMNIGECVWFLDIIASYQLEERIRNIVLQVWKLKVNLKECSAVVYLYDDDKFVLSQAIPYTSFILPEMEMWLTDGVILMPSEY